MTWTAPNTVATGDIYTAAMYNTYLRDNTLHLRSNTGNGDPTAANQVAVSTGVGAGSAWGTLPDAAMTNQKVNKSSPEYNTTLGPAAVLANSGFFEINAPSADAPVAGRKYHIFQAMKADGSVNYSVQIAVDVDETLPTSWIRVIVSGTPSAWYKLWNSAIDGSGSTLDADLLDGLQSGNGNGNIPISNGTVNTNLNADMLDGYHAGNSSGAIPINNGTLNTNLNAAMLGGSSAALVTPVVGEVRIYAGSSETPVAAKGWKFLNGQRLNKVTFSALFNLIGTTYGAGTTEEFDLPDLRDRFPLGKGVTYALAAVGGASTKNLQHSHAMPHRHTATSWESGDSGKFNGSSVQDDSDMSGNGFWLWDRGHHHLTSGTTDTTIKANDGTTTITNTNDGGSATQDIMPPYITLNYMIYTGVAS